MRSRFLSIVAFVSLIAGSGSIAHADQVRVFSIQGADCADCGTVVIRELKKVKGVKKAEFDMLKVEITLKTSDRVNDDAVLAAIRRAGLKGVVGAGHGSYLPHEPYPKGADVVFLTNNGGAVGPLEKLRVSGKYTVFDVYADWCGPCRAVDAKLRALAASRTDLAIRKLNVVSFGSPLARELGQRLKALPYVVVYSPDGTRTEITGADLKRLASAVGES
jgi:thiol-disulfide isomerase/thioredoxin